MNATYTAKFSDSFIAVKRLQLANEGVIRESITNFLKKLRELNNAIRSHEEEGNSLDGQKNIVPGT